MTSGIRTARGNGLPAGLRIATLFCVLVLLLGHSRASGQSQTAPAAFTGDPDFIAFIKEYVSAVNAKDTDAIRKLIEPKCLEAAVERDKAYADRWVKQEFNNTVAPDFKVSGSPIPPEASLPFAQMNMSWPVRPTHQIKINLDPTRSRIRWLVREDQHWYEVLPIPGKKGA